MVLRSMYLDPKMDAELAARAELEGVTKAELMRRYIEDGLARPAAAFAKYAEPPETPGPDRIKYAALPKLPSDVALAMMKAAKTAGPRTSAGASKAADRTSATGRRGLAKKPAGR